MAATATARKTASRAAARRRQAPRRGRTTTIPARLVPVAVGRTAGAVGSIADSGLVLRLTRGQWWIGALAALLVGIVALNVFALSINSSSSKSARAADELKRQNSALRAELARELSSERVQRIAATLGLIVPEPGAIRYLDLVDAQIAEAARRLRSGDFGAPVASPPVDLAAAAVAPPATTAPVDPATQVPPVEAPVVEEAPVDATAPPAVAPAVAPAAATPPAGGTASGGGVASP